MQVLADCGFRGPYSLEQWRFFWNDPMEMQQIRYFLGVAKSLNFSVAAEECSVSQPALSRAIIKLEQELGGDLFHRERGLTHLTELGRIILPLLKQCLESAEAAKKLADCHKTGSRAFLRLALSHTISMQTVVGPLTELVKALPGIELKLIRGSAAEVGEQLKCGEVDLGIACPLVDDWERFESWNLFTEPLGLVVNIIHPLARKISIPLDQINGERLLPRPYCEQADELTAILAARGMRVDFHDSIASDHDLTSLLTVNVGVAIMPRSSQLAGTLQFVQFQDLKLERTAVLYAVAGRQRSPAASGLAKLLRAADWTKLTDGIDQDRTATSALDAEPMAAR